MSLLKGEGDFEIGQEIPEFNLQGTDEKFHSDSELSKRMWSFWNTYSTALPPVMRRTIGIPEASHSFTLISEINFWLYPILILGFSQE